MGKTGGRDGGVGALNNGISGKYRRDGEGGGRRREGRKKGGMNGTGGMEHRGSATVYIY